MQLTPNLIRLNSNQWASRAVLGKYMHLRHPGICHVDTLSQSPVYHVLDHLWRGASSTRRLRQTSNTYSFLYRGGKLRWASLGATLSTRSHSQFARSSSGSAANES